MTSLARVRAEFFGSHDQVDRALETLDLIHGQVGDQLRILRTMVDQPGFPPDQLRALILGTIALLVAAEPSFGAVRSYIGNVREVMAKLLERDQ